MATESNEDFDAWLASLDRPIAKRAERAPKNVPCMPKETTREMHESKPVERAMARTPVTPVNGRQSAQKRNSEKRRNQAFIDLAESRSALLLNAPVAKAKQGIRPDAEIIVLSDSSDSELELFKKPSKASKASPSKTASAILDVALPPPPVPTKSSPRPESTGIVSASDHLLSQVEPVDTSPTQDTPHTPTVKEERKEDAALEASDSGARPSLQEAPSNRSTKDSGIKTERNSKKKYECWVDEVYDVMREKTIGMTWRAVLDGWVMLQKTWDDSLVSRHFKN